MVAIPKPSRTDRKIAELKAKRWLEKHERDEKAKVRRRDKACRFPLCGCKALRLSLHVSHNDHKGMGGNPAGDRSRADQMIYLCGHRHQWGKVSIHKGTLRCEPLTADGTDGPVVWLVDVDALPERLRRVQAAVPPGLGGGPWTQLAIELRPCALQPLLSWQLEVLGVLAEMDL